MGGEHPPGSQGCGGGLPHMLSSQTQTRGASACTDEGGASCLGPSAVRETSLNMACPPKKSQGDRDGRREPETSQCRSYSRLGYNAVTKSLCLNQPSFMSHPCTFHLGCRGLSRAALLQGAPHQFSPLLSRGVFETSRFTTVVEKRHGQVHVDS